MARGVADTSTEHHTHGGLPLDLSRAPEPPQPDPAAARPLQSETDLASVSLSIVKEAHRERAAQCGPAGNVSALHGRQEPRSTAVVSDNPKEVLP